MFPLLDLSEAVQMGNNLVYQSLAHKIDNILILSMQLSGRALLLYALGREFEPPSCFYIFLSDSKGSGVRILHKNGNFPAVISSYRTSLSAISLKSYACTIKEECRRVPELGQKITFLCYYLVKKKKMLNIFKLLRENTKTFFLQYIHTSTGHLSPV